MERARQMFRDGLIAQNARDDAEKNYELAVTRQQSATVNLGVARAAIAKADAQLEQARAVVARAEEDLRNATHRFADRGCGALARSRSGRRGQFHSGHGLRSTLVMTLGDLSKST